MKLLTLKCHTAPEDSLVLQEAVKGKLEVIINTTTGNAQSVILNYDSERALLDKLRSRAE